ncbi:MAG: exodeoxyribonuclease VII large subunit [Saprospiraceae bacterium]|nr:exodeoxyribonuclease VII large subunit [Saprospiraceae bacterium]MCF8249342.1 exodeoxyribonuclease VII large subunit [Saprospiraceae bacterium]MCF8311381.1 exodeoxyribonuclease VII large subunit [Saprospiraceae bacterium]MCF8439961.1 exodeoxyribonuclease VII large subunit [Saprospiraceae bacterium]
MSQSLFEFNEFIRRVIALNLPEPLWIRAELSDVKSSKGHFYLDLVQKKEDSEEIIAQAQAVIWSKNYRALQKKLGQAFERLLQPGMEILILAKAEFHERFGLKLMVEDVDPAHTLGKLEMQRRETIRQLQTLNLLQKNGRLPLPLVVQRIAVLSSEKAAGYQDFMKHLSSNSFGYQFSISFFPVAVQGMMVEKEAISQLENLARRREDFDVVVIIRGGGARLDLAAFDSFLLAKTLADIPLPILTGIGHDTDETVADLVAHTSLKTPTAVADFILHRNLGFESQITNLGLEAKNKVMQLVQEKAARLQYLTQLIDYQVKSNFTQQVQMLDFIAREVPGILKNRFVQANNELNNYDKIVQLLGPEAAFRRGFALVFKQGKHVSEVAQLDLEDEVQVHLKSGRFQALVKKLQ